MKTFKDLVFESHSIGRGQHAVLEFDNGYGVSVLLGDMFYSNGVDTYELGVLANGYLCYETPITDDVLGRVTEEEITKIMKELQSYESIKPKPQMKVFACTRTDSYSGGVALVAARSAEEAFEVFHSDPYYQWMLDNVDKETGEFIDDISKCDSYYYKREDWEEMPMLSTDVEEPMIIIEDGYSE